MLKNIMKAFMVFLTFITSVSQAAAQNDLGLVGDIRPPQQASEYIYRSSPKESLISVQLLGAIQKPGVYYVPTNTDLLKLLTLAGGSTNSGDLSEVMVRKSEPEKWADLKSKAVDEHRGTYEVDIQELIKIGGSSSLKMNHDDLVYVPPREALVSPETSRTITVISVVLSIAVSGLLISKYSKNE
jgi:competence protein ComEA